MGPLKGITMLTLPACWLLLIINHKPNTVLSTLYTFLFNIHNDLLSSMLLIAQMRKLRPNLIVSR